jgi:hypothetical protein
MTKQNRADAYSSEAHHQRHISRQAEALDRKLRGTEGGRLGMPTRAAKGRLPEIDHLPVLLRRPENSTSKRIGQVAPKFSDLLGVAKDMTDAFSVEERWRSTRLLKEHLGRMLMPGERVWVELEKSSRAALRFSAIRIRNGSDSLLLLPREKVDAIGELLSSAEGSRTYLSDPPSLFRMEGKAPPVEKCTFDNPGGKPLRAERSNAEYRRMGRELMRLYGVDADASDTSVGRWELP